MSRLERNVEKRSKKRRFKKVIRVVVIFFMITITFLSIVIVDNSAKQILGEESQVQIVVSETKEFVERTIKDISKSNSNIIKQINKILK